MRINCRVCGGEVETALDLGRQPLVNSFPLPAEIDSEYFFPLAIGKCENCTTVQLINEVDQELRYHDAYRYRASGSISHRRHFAQVARRFIASELTGPGAFIVEIGSNDGVMLATIADAGIRHLGVEPAGDAAREAAAKGVRVHTGFFDEATARDIRVAHGTANVIFGANTICHIAHVGSLFRGVDALLADDGVFVFEEPYFGTIVEKSAFDQIYDEHVFYFTVRSVHAMATHFGFELIDAEPVSLHGGEIRYTIARPGRRTPTASVASLLAGELARGLASPEAFRRLRKIMTDVRVDLVALLRKLRSEGCRVVGYGAPAKCTTVTNLCGIGPELVPVVYDSTPAKHGRLVAGSHIPVAPSVNFSKDYPDYAVLFSWNHAEEIIARERGFTEAGGQWISYIPDVHVINI
jgi:SAM-dependent methyltransferase